MKHDDKIKSLTKVLEEKKEGLKKPSGNYKTSCMVIMSDGSRKSIVTANSIDKVLELFKVIVLDNQAWRYACKTLSIKYANYEYLGYIFDDWVHDVKLKIQHIEYESKKRQFSKISETLESLESEDLKTEKALDKIENLLK